MNQLTLCSRYRARVIQAASNRCPCTHSSDTGSGRRILSVRCSPFCGVPISAGGPPVFASGLQDRSLTVAQLSLFYKRAREDVVQSLFPPRGVTAALHRRALSRGGNSRPHRRTTFT
jgi:hypothetical protein